MEMKDQETGWRGYRVWMRLLSPLHLGARTVGSLKQTRRYVPGRAIWGTLACRMGRDEMGEDYERAEGWVDENLRYSYWYASDGAREMGVWPWEEEERFAWLHMGSYASTALADGRAKQDGSLHETEYLSPVTRAGRPVYLHGLMWVRGRERPPQAGQVGGERAYGWGRLGAMEVEELDGKTRWGGWEWRQKDGEVVVSGGRRLLAHARAEGMKAEGRLEALVGRTTKKNEFGKSFSEAVVSWAPGSMVRGRFRVGRFGVWESCEGD